MRILLVDDSVEFLDVAARILSADSIVEIVGRAQSGYEALRRVNELRPDLVLMDLAMPGMNGLEATRLIKEDPLGPKVVILTLHDNREYRTVAEALGADGFVSKSELGTQLQPLIQKLATEHASPAKGVEQPSGG